MNIFHQAFGGTSTDNDWKEDLKISKEALKKAKVHGYDEKNYIRFYYCNFSSWKHIVKKDFENTYAKCNIPILYIIGSNDLYIDPITEVNKLKSFNNDMIKIIVFENLNHYLTQGELYEKNMYEIDDFPKNEIINWILKQ